jgi:hypothetical protein
MEFEKKQGNHYMSKSTPKFDFIIGVTWFLHMIAFTILSLSSNMCYLPTNETLPISIIKFLIYLLASSPQYDYVPTCPPSHLIRHLEPKPIYIATCFYTWEKYAKQH